MTGRLHANSAVRARQLRLHIERLGPAFVKVAQALSTRVDILDANYLTQIELLQVGGCCQLIACIHGCKPSPACVTNLSLLSWKSAAQQLSVLQIVVRDQLHGCCVVTNLSLLSQRSAAQQVFHKLCARIAGPCAAVPNGGCPGGHVPGVGPPRECGAGQDLGRAGSSGQPRPGAQPGCCSCHVSASASMGILHCKFPCP